VLRALIAQGGAGSPAPNGIRSVTLLDSFDLARSSGAKELELEAQNAGVSVTRTIAPLDGSSLPYPDASFDLVFSSMSLHWINDVPRLFSEVRRVLKPDGAFILAFLGGNTLDELKCVLKSAERIGSARCVLRSLTPPSAPSWPVPFYRRASSAAEQERDGGVSPRVSPMMNASDAGNLISGAGFGLPTVDVDTISIEYPSAGSLFDHLRAMGESNAAIGARGGSRRDTLLATAAAYTELFGAADGSIPVTFQVIYAIGWAPAPSQPTTKERGSVPKGFGMRKTNKA
jgi:NADH dehydrogenase [ubiquinone] 1 alpha subcomplex assembly factor 5